LKITTRRALLGSGGIAVLLALSGCSRLGLLNGLNDVTPGDGNTVREATAIAYGSDPRQVLDIYAPKDARNAPVVVFFYGGSWNSGRRQDYAFAGRAFAARGFVTVVADYRLVPQVRYPAFVEDGAATVAWTRANIARHGGNPDRIGVAGHSAGGYIAMMLALDPRWLAAAGASGAIKAVVGIAGPYDIAPFAAGGSAEAAFGAAPDARDTQPIAHARSTAPPALLLTGDEDVTVRPRNVTALAAALKAAGATVETRVYPGIGHIGIVLALSKPFRGKAPALADGADFLHRYLG
jgi:acetyl esterase/lipase